MKRGIFSLFFLFVATVFLFFPENVFASIVINEFLPNPSDTNKEWVEFYNPDRVEMGSYWLDDDPSFTDDAGSGKIKSLFSLNTANPIYPYLEFNSFLNNGGDWVVLFSPEGTIIDQYHYISSDKDRSWGRSPDGVGLFTVLASTTKGAPNTFVPLATPTTAFTPTPLLTLAPTSTSTPTPTSVSLLTSTLTPTPTAIPTPTLAKAIYQINEVKSKNGDVLSSVKIYIDSQYIHHYAPEELEFGDHCFCDNDKKVACNFGHHQIRLERNGYQNWYDERTVESGESYEVDPVMILLPITPTPTMVMATATPILTISPINLTATPPLAGALSLSGPTPPFILKMYSLIPKARISTSSSQARVLGEQWSEKRNIIPSWPFFIGGVAYIAFPVYQLRKRWYNKFKIKIQKRPGTA